MGIIGVNLNKNVVGLTGKYCSGKSSVEKILVNKYGFLPIDVDSLGHKALNEKKDKLINIFGVNIATRDRIDRKKLGKIVFNSKEKLLKLNSIVHPLMVDETKKIIEKNMDKNICINAALLYEMGLYKLCSKIIIVKSSLIDIIKRAKKRDKRSFFDTINIIFKQKGIKKLKILNLNADISYIENKKNLQFLEKQLDRIIKVEDKK